MLQAIVFDFDGVLVHTEPLHHRAFMAITQPRGVSCTYEEYCKYYIGFDDRDGFRTMFDDADVPLDEADLPRMIQAKAEAFAELIGNDLAALPGVVNLIHEAMKELPIAICSGATKQDIEIILPHLGIDNAPRCFGTIVSADDVEHSKPNPACYELAAARIGIDPQHCLAIEDTPTGLQSAIAAGMHTLGVGTSFPIEMLTIAHRSVASLTDVNLKLLQQWYG